MAGIVEMDFNCILVCCIAFLGCFIFQIVVWPIIFYVFPICVQINKERPLDLYIRTTSAILTAAIGLSSIYASFFETTLINDKVWGWSYMTQMNGSLAVGFMIYELIHQLRDPANHDLSMKLHHIVCGTAVFTCVINGYYLWFVSFRMAQEISTPFLNIGWILLQCGYEKSPVYKTIVFSFVTLFTLTRILAIVPAWVSWWYVAEQGRRAGLKWYVISILNATLDVINMYWLSKLIAKASQGSLTDKKLHAKITSNGQKKAS